MNAAGKIKWGILGAGSMASNFADALKQVDEAQLEAVASRSKDRSDAFGKKNSVKKCYSNYDDLVNDSAIDIVYIAVPHSLHKDLSVMCLEAGKAVVCEKPFAINAGQAAEVIQLAKKKNLFLMEAMWTRFLPVFSKLRAMLSQEVIGDIQIMLSGGAYMPDFDPEFYLFNKSLGGGILLDAGVYPVSIASMIFGVPKKILAMGELGVTGVDEHDAALLSYPSGAIANIYVSHRGKQSPDMTLIGSKGKIYLSPPVFSPSAMTLCVDGQAEEVFDFTEPGSGYRYQIQEANRCLQQGKQESEIMPLNETLEIMRTMDEIRQQIGICYIED